jgi:hypothetical protein
VENALFYTFSTIAQTLAAAIALLGAFALYRLQSIGASLRDLADSVIQPYLPNDTALKLSGEEKFAELDEYLRNTPPANPQSANAPFYSGKRSAFADHVATRASIQCLLKWVLATTVMVISGAVAVLGVTPTVVSVGAPTAVLVVGIGAFIGCLVFYAVFVMAALK